MSSVRLFRRSFAALCGLSILLGAPAALQAATVKVDRKGLTAASDDGNFTMTVGGRIHADLSFHEGSSGATDGTEIRRGRLSIKGTIQEDFGYMIEADFADNEVAVKDLFLSFKPFAGLTISAGHQKQPYSLAIEMSSNDIPFTERAIDYDIIVPFVDRAIGLRADANGEHWFFATGFYGDNMTANKSGLDEGYGAVARLVVSPIIEADRVVHVGFRGAYRRPAENARDTVRLRDETTHLSNLSVIDTGDITDVKDVVIFGPEAALAWGPFSIFGEYNFLEGDLGFSGGHVGATWSLTGESRAATYAIKSGEFKMLNGNEVFSLKNGTCGAIELSTRYAYADLNGAGVRGGKEQTFQAGINWYLNPNVRTLFNWTHVIDADGGLGAGESAESLNAFSMRLQFTF